MSKETKVLLDPNNVKASPTKEFFISMLIRDITLKDAIGDLIDNCVDGARSLRTNKNYSGLNVIIKVTPTEFQIKDNCGGFTVETARKYAFRFGRPAEFNPIKGSVGQFGIGMKRALFKIGTEIEIESTTKSTYFKIIINVNEWRKDELNWDFKFDKFEEGKKFPNSRLGTSITIKNLSQEASKQFSDGIFITELINEIEKENMFNIHSGLKITINANTLKERELYLISTNNIKPALQKIISGKVTATIHVGVGSDDNKYGGWYIFCNDRLVVGPEQTSVTGWTGQGKGGVANYHDQFSRFRGYVFFNSDDASLLPWSTTKTTMNLDSPLFIAVRQRMIEMMKPVITFLNKIKKEKEKDNPLSNQPLNLLLVDTKEKSLSKIKPTLFEKVFTFPNNLAPKPLKENGKTITYSKPSDQIDAVKEYFNVATNREVGEKTFDYFYKNEIN